MTFSLLYLPSFRGPAQTPGWIHFPLNYQNRAESDRKKCVEESSVPRPLHKGICPPIYARAWGLWGDWTGHPVPSTSILSPPSSSIVLCALTQFALGGVASEAWLKRPHDRNTPFSHTEAKGLRAPWFGVPLPVVLLKRKYSGNRLQHQASFNHRLHKVHFWGDRTAQIYTNQERIQKGARRPTLCQGPSFWGREKGRSRVTILSSLTPSQPQSDGPGLMPAPCSEREDIFDSEVLRTFHFLNAWPQIKPLTSVWNSVSSSIKWK